MDEDPLQQEPVVLIIDALDECEDEDDVELILYLFAQAKDLRSVPLRIFITSRPETAIMYGMDGISETVHQDFILHNISRPIVSGDISLFLRYELEKIKKRRHIRGEWPGEENIDTLIQRADGLFIYAATICRFLGERGCNPNERLSIVLEGKLHSNDVSPTSQLDSMYENILRYAMNMNETFRKNFR